MKQEATRLTKSESMLMGEYQHFTVKTDQNSKTGYAGLMLPLLGLFGEVGSLLSELKKKQRDTDSYVGYEDAVLEEFGDVLWYFANISQRANLDLNLLVQRMFLGTQISVSVGSLQFGTFRAIQ